VPTISARGGNATNTGAAGTIYLKGPDPDMGEVIVDNDGVTSSQVTLLRTSLATFRRLTGSGRGAIALVDTNLTSLTVEQPVQLTGSSALAVGGGVTLAVTNTSGFDVQVLEGSRLTLSAGSALNAERVRVNGAGSDLLVGNSLDLSLGLLELSGGPLATTVVDSGGVLTLASFSPANVQSGRVQISIGGRLRIASERLVVGRDVYFVKDGAIGEGDLLYRVEVDSGGRITHSPHLAGGLVLRVVGSLTVNRGAAITANGKGLFGGNRFSQFGQVGEALDASGNLVSGSSGGFRSAAGGSHGGRGAAGDDGGTPSPAYGDPVLPSTLGGGGGAGSASGAYGGNGGGRITIQCDSLAVNGFISASGDSGLGAGGGGAGGSILIRCKDLSGSGAILAQGGFAGCVVGQCSGSGGGGRLAVYAEISSLSSDQFDVASVGGQRPGNPGSIFAPADLSSSVVMAPRVGGNSGIVSLQIRGPRVLNVTSAALVRAGTPEIPAILGAAEGTTLNASFDLTNAPLGAYDIHVHSSSHGISEGSNAFTIVQGTRPEVETSFLGSAAIFQGRPQRYLLRLTNTGNIDAHGCLVFSLPPKATYTLLPLEGPTEGFRVSEYLLTSLRRCDVAVPAGQTLYYLVLTLTIGELVPHAPIHLQSGWLSHD
jgi:hypothetical protein